MGNHREKNNQLIIIINLWLMEEVEHDSKNIIIKAGGYNRVF